MSSKSRPSPLAVVCLLLMLLAAAWSPLGAAQLFRRGDSNADGVLNISDAIHILGFLFLGSPDRIPCEDATDSNDDGKVNISDAVNTLGFLFLGTPPPPPPFGSAPSDCGEDPTADALGCETFGPCPSATDPPAPPVLEPPASPTRAPSIELHGMTGAGLHVRITGGGSPIPVLVLSGADGAFSATVTLSVNRLNRLFAIVEDAGGRASAPAAVEVTQDSDPPFVYIDEPADGAKVMTERIAVTGRVSDMLSGFLGLGVTVNGEPAAIAIGIGTNGTFERQDVPLAPGENRITVVASDVVGNTATREVRITREQPPPGSDRIELVSGNGQDKRPIYTTLPQPIVVRARKAGGAPLAGKVVTFQVVRSDGRLASGPGVPPDDRVMTLTVPTDANGLAAAHWTLGGDAGCGNNRVKAAGAGLAGEVLFCASAAPGPAAQINVGTGQNQRGEAGAPAPEVLRAWVSDGCNGIEGVPVTFRVTRGTGNVNGADSVTVPTGPTGHALARFVLGRQAGKQSVEADFVENLGSPATFVVYALLRDEARPTTFTGVVLDNAEQPIQGAVCLLEVSGFEGEQISSDLHGRFAFTAPAGGPASLRVEGSFATHVGGEAGHDIAPGTFPSLVFEVILVPNAENSLPGPVLLPPLNPENAVTYDGTGEVVLKVKEVEGLEMLVGAGTLVTLRDGTKVGPGRPGSVRLALNQVHHDDVPMPMPDGAAPPFAWTLQPGGARFEPPIRVKYPNMSGLPPGAIANFLSFNHGTGKFEIVSSGGVSADGSLIESDPGSGITVAGWGCNCPPYSVSAKCVLCDVSVTPNDEQVVCVNQPVKLTAKGGPTPGTMTWTGGGVPPTQTFTVPAALPLPTDTHQSVFETKFATPGMKAITAKWTCDTGGSGSETVDIVVVKLDFAENANQGFGFDELPMDPEKYVSCDKNGATKVDVKIDPFREDKFWVTSSNTGAFTVPGDAVKLTGATTEVTISGKNPAANHTSALLELRAESPTGPICGSLHVELYKKLSVPKVTYYRIKDSTVAATTPAKDPTFDELKTGLNKIYKQAVIEVLAVDGDRNKDIRYDLNKNGILDSYNDGTDPEVAAITGAGLTGDPKIAYIEKMRDNWRLTAAAAKDQKKVQLADVGGLETRAYSLGPPSGDPETITITAIDAATKTITVAANLAKAHPATDTLYQGLGGLGIDPQLVSDNRGTLLKIITHEMMHRDAVAGLSDVGDIDNIMYFATSGTGDKLRFHEQTVVKTGTSVPTGAKENQWNKVNR